MSEMQDRERAFENMFAHDQEIRFKVEARACKLFGLWLAGELGMGGAEADTFARMVVEANLDEPGFDDVLAAVRPSLEGKGLQITDEALNARLAAFTVEAKKHFMDA